ncbi:MAG: hypothetical protein RL141_122 [Candidatus Parcubacteria bacterium]|jgi:uncharacterized cofD-like protein
MKKIVMIGGGTGTGILLAGFKGYPVAPSVIVSSADDGGSSGVLRRTLSVFPPGDVRQCLAGLSDASPALQALFQYRFESGPFKGHPVGNLLLAALEQQHGSVEAAIRCASELLQIRGEVIPVTRFPTVLSATYEGGKTVTGEHQIDEPPRRGTRRIISLRLTPSAPANPRALKALRSANVIILGPGDLYTSALPSLLAKGVTRAIDASRARVVLVTNIMTKYGQTDGFQASDFVRVVNQYLGVRKVELAVINTKRPSTRLLGLYKNEKALFVNPDVQEIVRMGARVIAGSVLSDVAFRKAKGDVLQRSLVRHDAKKVAALIWKHL